MIKLTQLLAVSPPDTSSHGRGDEGVKAAECAEILSSLGRYNRGIRTVYTSFKGRGEGMDERHFLKFCSDMKFTTIISRVQIVEIYR
jgi:hypothetical protein